MSEHVYIPKACLDQTDEKGMVTKPATFAGSVTMKVLTFFESCALSEKLTMACLAVDSAIKDIRRASEVAKLAKEIIVSVNLKRLKDGKEFKSWDDVTSEAGIAMVGEISKAAIDGPAEGNG